MNVIRFSDTGFVESLQKLTGASSLFDQTVEERTRSIVEEVQSRGDAALLEFTERFDGARLRAEQIPVGTAELLSASLQADKVLRDAVTTASRNIEIFSRKS